MTAVEGAAIDEATKQTLLNALTVAQNQPSLLPRVLQQIRTALGQ
jgi:hypothetical protein